MARGKRSIVLATVPAALLALTLASCESTPLTGQEGGELRLSATQVTIDEGQGQTQGTSNLAAQLFDEAGRPMIGAEVIFATTAGTLASGGPPNAVETNSSGIATDVLTLSLTDPETVTVTAFSGKLSATEDVTRTTNPRPAASIAASPESEQVKGRTVTFSGAASTGQIRCHQWEIDSTLSGVRNEIVQAPGPPATLQRSYSQEQGLDVTLRVSSLATTPCPSGSTGTPPSEFNGVEDFIAYDIVCDLTPPSAAAGADRVVQGPSVTVTLDGSASRDPDSQITNYRWECGNGQVQSGTSPTVQCTYTLAGTTAQTFTATLTVTNGCQQTAEDRVNVTVLP
jgi:hypothetical protein